MHEHFSNDPMGWISTRALRSEFPVMKRMQVTESEIVSCCVSSGGFFVLNDSQTMIRRDFDRFPNQEVLDQLRSRSASPPDVAGSAVDARTAYVERIPVTMKQDELREKLTAAVPGVTVSYVSIPRHPVTGEGYGCAFLELGSEEELKKVVRKWRSIDCDLFDAKTGKLGFPVRVLTMAKFKALKAEYKRARSLQVNPENRLGYYPPYDPTDLRGDGMNIMSTPMRDSLVHGEENDGSSESSLSTILFDSDINSLAQDSVGIRRSMNASTIRSGSVVEITGLPATSSTNVRVWLSHSCSVQFLDHTEGDSRAYVRFASKRERDFFHRDFHVSNIPLLGTHPTVNLLTDEECIEYFENDRKRRRDAMGHPDLWAIGPTCKPRPNGTTTGSAAFTDSVAGNPLQREIGTSSLFHIKKGRHVARRFFAQSLDVPEIVEGESSSSDCAVPDGDRRKRGVSVEYDVMESKRARVGSDDASPTVRDKRPLDMSDHEDGGEQDESKRVKTTATATAPGAATHKKTRRGKRGGRRIASFR